MIQLTRLNNHPLVVNSDLIKFVEQAPDTVITLVSGEKIVVRESSHEVLERVILFRRSVLQGTMLWPSNASAPPPAVVASEHDSEHDNDNDNDSANENGNDHDSTNDKDDAHSRRNRHPLREK